MMVGLMLGQGMLVARDQLLLLQFNLFKKGLGQRLHLFMFLQVGERLPLEAKVDWLIFNFDILGDWSRQLY